MPKRYAPDEMERRLLARWKEEGTFQAQVEAGRANYEKDPARRFVFLEGPPTANGLPHPGHVLTRTVKDAVCRYHAMKGAWVPRKAGWDCHGLPVEIEVQKELGIEHVSQIVEYGVERFNDKCRASVFRYKTQWEEMSERVGFWLDYDDPYVTMDDRYIESVWWSLSRLFEAGLLQKSYKVVPYCPQTGTSYSSHEVAQGYKDVSDTAVFAKFHLLDDPDGARILSWTTTPWTLPGNVALAVGPDIDYVKVEVVKASDKANAQPGEVLIVAKALQKAALRNESKVLAEIKGRDLIGRKYRPLFPGAVDAAGSQHAWEVVPADFVTTEDGTGVVHTAVMYGEDDFQLGMRLGLPARHTVGLDGNFLPHVPGGIAGRYVKDPQTEAAILRHLRDNDLLYRDEAYEHSYPHCWRTGYPLLYYAMDSWYIRMGSLRDELMRNNGRVNWVPDNIKEGRMGDWLRNVKDWAFSRSRFWGTPLPVWTCSACGHQRCIGSRAELAEAGIDAKELHRPYVDQPIDCAKCGGAKTANREPYVIDVWYDSGAAQFAQWKATSADDRRLREHWPIDFIAEALDQTRGWFYSLLASATALAKADPAAAPLWEGPAYRNVVVMGLILGEDGQKMSKSKRNYVPAEVVMRNQGADATRWYLLSATPTWQEKRFSEEAVRETFGKFFSTLWNTFLFWHQYARLDRWTPEQALPISRWTNMDRWLHSRLAATVAEARMEADRFHLHKATRAIEAFVIDDLSNWWVRRGRDRFWAEKESDDKLSAHSALWTALHTVCRLVAPFAPFMVEHVWTHVRGPKDPPSVHLAPYPQPGARDDAVEEEMALIRQVAESGRALRSRINIPTRHPLGRAVLVGWKPNRFTAVLQDELNVKRLEARADAGEVRAFVAKPNRASLGKAFRQLAPQVADAIEALDGDRAHARLAAGEGVGVNVDGQEHEVRQEHVVFEQRDRDGWVTADVGGVVLALHVHRDEALLAEALAREVTRRIQDARRELDLALDEEVDVRITAGPDEEARLAAFLPELKADVRARTLDFTPHDEPDARVWDIDGVRIACTVRPTRTKRPPGIEAA
ncbi:MAG TPA: isoleucine--tRNA ligase [Candidatus Thermoplasmatota archaeon]|nr:isoleucine--tRNA ligase [Candidatus Thermoplasmatota archaeon]